MPTLVGMTMIQVVLSGALPLEASGLINQISKIVPSYWANNALSASVDLVQLNLVSDELLQNRWIATSSNVTTCLSLVALFSVTFIGLTLLRVRKTR